MRNINEITTEQLREASSKGFVASLGYRSIADEEFDYWLVRERNRVAEMATIKERERVYRILEDMADWIVSIPGLNKLTQSETIRYTVLIMKQLKDN